MSETKIEPDRVVLGASYNLTLKPFAIPLQKAEVLHIAQESKERDQPCIFQETVTLREASIYLILSHSDLFGFRLFSHGVI